MGNRNGALSRPTESRFERLGAAIRQSRGSRSQTDLGLLVGRPQATISTWENGRVCPDLPMVNRLEVVLGLPAGQLLIEAGFVDASLLGIGQSVTQHG